ncbi:hypothetical protein COLO4_33572 [Corchorus olitorius]|uniref:DUF7787 domain-containing protein n=1 Tax=Corchorus olitorius TaxID=93759 RepID=A0A1R3GSJ5_9ROSI|nr:hypothetical protein COLO4_33572 [Corchorus olitorius]
MKGSNPKISLEGYIDFVSSHKQLPLTKNFLNQIISIHGFRKMFRHPKQALCDAVETLDLMDLSRSTLKSSISASAPLTEKEIIGDLSHLEWQECCVTSIQTLHSSDEQPLVSVLKAKSKSKSKAKAKRKRSAGVAVAEGADSFSSALVPFNSSVSC